MKQQALVVVGTGLAAARLVEEVLARDPDRFCIRMFGDELTGSLPLHRILGGFENPGQLWLNPREWYDNHRVFVHEGVKVETIDRGQRTLTGAGGKVVEPYDYLVLATGARAFVPDLPGMKQAGVFVLQTLEDCRALGSYARECDRALVLGGGVLGLEAARGLVSLGLDVTLTEMAPHLLPQQLDGLAAAPWKRTLQALGVTVRLNTVPIELPGDGQVQGVRFADGLVMETDLVVICCGQIPRVEEAVAAGLAVDKAILVDEHLRTNDPAVFALGECAQLPGQILGLSDCFDQQATILADVLTAGKPTKALAEGKNKIETMKQERDGLSSLSDIFQLAARNTWEEMSEDDKQRFKWYGLFFRKPTPGNFMLRVRMEAGRTSARQFRVLADISDEFGKGFCDLTTRQQVQLRWFTIGDVPEIWRRLESVGLSSKQTGMDNVRGVCGCPAAGLTPHELFDASPVVSAYTRLIVGNPEFTNLPRKFNVTITGCLENCCHTETQDIALVPAYRELDGAQVNGFNVLVGGKQGSGGYRPATPLNVFTRPEEAARLCADITRLFRDHGSRASRTRARLAFLIEDRGASWFRAELERRWGSSLLQAGVDLRKKHHVDHLGIHPQKRLAGHEGAPLHYVGLLVPVGRITTAQMRAVADLAERYGNGDLRITVDQNLVIGNIPEHHLGAVMDEPLFKELPFDPSPILRGLVSCTGTDYCHMALIETKGWAVRVARELEQRTAGRKVLPLTMHWSGCSAGCGLHQTATIGLQGCRSRVGGVVVDAAHVCVNGRSGPNPVVASDLLYDVPCEQLAEALEPLVSYLPRL